MLFVLRNLIENCKRLCIYFFKRVAANERVLPMAGELKNFRLVTEVHCLFKDEKFILLFKSVPSTRTKADSDMPLIASTSGPAIGNTLVGRSFFPPEMNYLSNKEKSSCISCSKSRPIYSRFCRQNKD